MLLPLRHFRPRDARERFTLAIPVGAEPPREFRIFAAGENTTRKGTIVFDDAAARAVMAAYAEHGADIMIDLEHLSLDQESNSFDPDARGWAKLELRNGELWAVDVTWTPDGAARLRDKTQRYISPVVDVDHESRRAQELFNIAITALPATDNLTPLVAATDRGDAMSPEQLAAIAEALGLGADANVEDVLATIAAMVKKVQDAANGGADDGPPDSTADVTTGGDAAMAAADKPADPSSADDKKEAVAATARLMRLTGRTTLSEVVAEVETWRQSHLTLDKERKALAREKEALEAGERRKLVGELVKLGAEIPATAWSDAAGTKPVKRLQDEPLADLRARVAAFAQAKSGKTPLGQRPVLAPVAAIVPPTTSDGELSESELAACKAMNAKPDVFARNKQALEAARATRRAG